MNSDVSLRLRVYSDVSPNSVEKLWISSFKLLKFMNLIIDYVNWDLSLTLHANSDVSIILRVRCIYPYPREY